MATAQAPNRASLLAGLRTGGVRSTSSPLAGIPHTAAPGGSFSVPRFQISSPADNSHFPAEEEDDEVNDIHFSVPTQAQQQQPQGVHRQMPMTAALDGMNNRFQQQQGEQRAAMNGMNPRSMPFSPGMQQQPNAQVQVQAQQIQMQLMQMEILRLQSVQAQQYQNELLNQQQAQRRQSQNLTQRRTSFNPPATAGPLQSSFGALPNVPVNGTDRRMSYGALMGVGMEEPPKTAALGGKFGGRFGQGESDGVPPPTPSYTTVISGGTSLGSMASNNTSVSNAASTNTASPASKSDSASTWRRGGNNNSVLSGNRSVSVRVTPPPGDRVSPPPTSNSTGALNTKARPAALRFNAAASQPMDAVAVAIEAIEQEAYASDAASSVSGKSISSRRSGSAADSSPTTSSPPLSPREEAAKKLYEGLGMGRPAPAPTPTTARAVSMTPVRQPRGPPSGADELGPKNFATRMRRKALGGLGALMDVRERRDVEVY